MDRHNLDCVIIGYNELPFAQYEQFLRNYGKDTEAYRDLMFSFVELNGQKMDYIGLMNHVCGDVGQHGSVTSAEGFKSGDIPNLAAVYLTNFLRNRNLNVRYINLFQWEKEKLIEYLHEYPFCVAITTTFYVVNQPVNEMVEFIRRHNDKVAIVVGGPLVSNHARNNQGDSFKTALDDMGADIYVIEGQGELTLTRIVQCLKQGGKLSTVPNIVYFEKGEMQRTNPATENNSLDEEFIDWRKFSDQNLGPTLQTRTARSCAFKCSFCNYPSRAGALTLTSLDVIERELDSMYEIGNVRNVVFIDDTFNVPFPRFKEICRLMIRNKYDFNWFSYFRCSNSDEEAIDLMAQSGCKGVFLGIESGSPAILGNMNKSATVEKYAQGIKWLKSRGIMTFGSFIVGFPGETQETVKETVDFIKENQPDYYRAQMWYCEPGTPIQMHRQRYAIKGEGFVWSHATMDSLSAMDQIDQMFLSVQESIWLPQWSFDFWIVPYLIGRGISLDRFKVFMSRAHKLLALEIASVPEHHKKRAQKDLLEVMIREAHGLSPSYRLARVAGADLGKHAGVSVQS
jgi:radical SAM PhpK family P-methyltransferase